jgi:hypothetical protein
VQEGVRRRLILLTTLNEVHNLRYQDACFVSSNTFLKLPFARTKLVCINWDDPVGAFS